MIPTNKAIDKLREEMINRLANAGLGFRVYQASNHTGDSRLALKIDKKGPEDETIEARGVQLFLDPVHSSMLKDVELDFDASPSGGFILKKNQD
jgi:Fe-S cluster assembly iron-binding protein IscA